MLITKDKLLRNTTQFGENLTTISLDIKFLCQG